jgi:hypothetical protein
MTDDNIIGIDGRPAAELRTDQAEREKREETLRQKLKIVGYALQPGIAPGSQHTLKDGATYRWIKSRTPRQTLRSVRIHDSAVAS